VSPGQQCRGLHVKLPLLLRWSLPRHVGWARERERHHEPTGAAGLDEKEPNWIKHQGHHLLPCKSVGHLLLVAEPREHEKFLLWGRVFRPIQWSRWWWWWSRVNVDVGIFKRWRGSKLGLVLARDRGRAVQLNVVFELARVSDRQADADGLMRPVRHQLEYLASGVTAAACAAASERGNWLQRLHLIEPNHRSLRCKMFPCKMLQHI